MSKDSDKDKSKELDGEFSGTYVEGSGKDYRKVRRRRLTERLSAARERANMLEVELLQYTARFFRVCIFGSARIEPEDKIFHLTHRTAYLLGAEGIDVLTGGGPGLMYAANKGAKEGREETGSGSKSFGISIELGNIEPENEHLDIKHHHKRFSSRLDDFMRLSNAVIVMQGGIGTLLELFFSWQLIQVKHLPPRPIILLGKDYYGGLIEWMKATLLEQGMVNAKDFDCLHLVDTPEEALAIIKEDYTTFLEELEKFEKEALLVDES